MKRCFINIKLLIYIILLLQWKALESLPTSSSSDKSPAPSNPSGGQSATPRSQNQTSSSSTQSQLRTSTNNSTRTNSSSNQQNQSPGSPSQSQSQPQSSSSTTSVTTPTGTQSEQSQVTKITVDIDKKSSTNQLEYSKNDEIHKYTPKSGYGFNKVTNGSAVIWESDDNVYSLRVALNDVSSNPEEHFLSVLDNKGRLFLFQKSSDKSWKDVTEDRYCLFNLKFLTDNDEEIAKDKYSLCIYCFTYSCAFDKGSKCSKIKYDDKIIWDTNDHSGFAPIKEVYLYMIPIKAFVRGNNDQYKKLELKKSAQPKETVDTVAKVTDASDTKSSPAPVPIQSTPTRPTTRLTNVIVDIDKKQNSNEFDYSSDENYHTYTRKTGHSCSKVMQGTSLIWESQDNTCGTLVRFKEQKLLVILLDNNTFKLFKHSDVKTWTDITRDRYDVTKLKLLGEGDSVLTPSKYKIDIVDLSFCYSLNQGIKCAAVKLGEDVVWRHDEDPKFQQIKTFFLGLASNNFYVKNMSDEIKKLEFKPTTPTTPEAKPTTTPTTTRTTATKPATQTTAQPQAQTTARPRTQPQSPTTSQPRTQPQSPTTPTTQRPKSSEAESLEKYELPGFKLLTLNSSGNEVDLEKSKYQITKDRDEHVYDLNDGVKCHEVKYQDKTVWKRESDSDKYPLYITYKIDDDKFVITFEDGFVTCIFEDNGWKRKVHSLKQGEALPESKEMVKVDKVVLDLNELKSNDSYEMNQTGNVKTFTPKNNGVFTGVIRTTGSDKVNWTTIWQIQGDFELANSISYEDFGKGKQVLILDTRSGLKMLYKANQNAYWKEVAEQPQNAFETIGALTVKEEKVDMFEVNILEFKSSGDYDYKEFDTEEQPKPEEKKQIEDARKGWKKKDAKTKGRRPPSYKYHNCAAKPQKGISNIIDPDTAEKGEDDDDPGFDGSIWRQANLTQYATHACFRCTPKRCLAVLLSSGNFLLYEEKADEELDDITSKSRGEFFKLAFYTKEQETNTYRKLKIEEITRSLLNLSYIFTFDNIECHRITHDNKTIWRHGVDSNFGTLKSVYFHLLDYKVSVENTSGKKEDLDIKKAKDSKLDDSDPILQKSTTATAPKEPTKQVVTKQESDSVIPKADLTSLNLDSSDITSKHQCYDSGIYKTFTALHGHGFNEVKVGSTSLWKSNNIDEYAIKVRLKESSSGEKYVILLLVSKKFKFFHSPEKNKPLTDDTAGKKSFNDIKLFYKNETKRVYEELDPNSYTAALYHLSLGYKPREGVKFHLIKFSDKYVYNYDEDQSFGYLKGVYIDLMKNNLYVVNIRDKTKEIDIEKGVLTQPTITPVKTKPEPPRVTTQPETKAKKTPVTPPETKTTTAETTPSEPETSPVPEAKASPVTAPSTTLITLNIDNTQSTGEFDYSKDENYHTYIPKDDHVFSKVTEKNAVICEWKDNIYAKFARIRPKENEKYLAILLTNNTFKLFHQSHGKTWTDITKDKHDMTKLRFYGESDAVLKSTHYTVSIVDLSFNYAFNEGVNCRKINYDDNVVWNHSDDNKFEFIKSFSLGLVSNKFFVKNASGEVKKIEHKQVEEEVVDKVAVTPVGTVPETGIPSFVDPTYTLLKLSGDPAPDSVKLYSSKSGEHECKVEKFFDDLDYNLKGLQCEVITHSGNCVWKHETGKEYPESMTYKDDDTIIVTFDEVYYICTVQNNEWKSQIRKRDGTGPIETGPSYPIGKAPETKPETKPVKPEVKPVAKATPVKISVAKPVAEPAKPTETKPVKEPEKPAPEPEVKAPEPESTAKRPAAKDAVRKPTPTPEAKPATTPEPPKPVLADKSIALDIETTESTSQFEFSEANYIKTFNGKNDCVFEKVSEGPTVVWESEGVSGTMVRTKLFSNNDRFLVILLKNDMFMVFQKPAGGVWSEITGSRCDVKKLKFFGENDKEITAKDYRITLSDLSFSHMFKEGVKCTMVKMGEEVVWSHTDDKRFEEIMTFSLGLVSNKFFVKNRNGELKKLEPKPVVEPVVVKAEAEKVTTTGAKPVVKSVKEEVKPAARLTGQVTSAFHSKLKLYASDPVDSSKTVPLEFEVLEYPNPDSLLYLLGDRCVQLIFDGKVVWEYTSGPYPTSLYFKSSAESSLLYLNFDPYYYVYIYDSSDWVLKEELSHRSSVELDPSMYPENITIVTEKTEGESVTLVLNDTNMYKVYDHGGIFLYLFSDGVKCVEIKYCDHTVHDAKSVGQYPNRFIFESKSLTFEFDFENKSTSYRLSDSEFSASGDSKKLEKIEYEVPGWIRKQSNYKFGSKLSLSDLSILTSDNRDGSDAKRIDVKKSMLSSKKWLSGFFYPVTKPYLELRYKDNVFKSTEYPYRGNPKILLFNIDDNNISIFFDSKFKVSFNYLDLSDEETVFKAKRKPTDPDPDSSVETDSDSDSDSNSNSNSNSESENENENENEIETVPVTEIVVTPPKTTVTTPESQPQTVYSPTPKVSTSGPKLSQPKSSSVSTGSNFNPESKPIPKQAKTKAPVITIPSEPTDLKSSTNLAIVDIKKKHNTNEFNYYRNDNFKTYVPKSGYGFSKVTEGSSVIWESGDVFATFVTTKRKKFLVTLLQSGDILLFHKNNAEQPWEDITDKRYDLKKLKFFGENDTEITSSNYTVTLVKTIVEFKFEDGVNCKKIKYGDDNIWNHTDDAEFPSIKMFQFGLVSNDLYVQNSSNDWKKLNYKGQNTPPETESDTVTPSE